MVGEKTEREKKQECKRNVDEHRCRKRTVMRLGKS